MNLAFEKGERVTTGGKSRGGIRGEVGKVIEGWLQVCLPWIAWEIGVEHLVEMCRYC